jgi:hypothetical protein
VFVFSIAGSLTTPAVAGVGQHASNPCSSVLVRADPC